MINPLFIIKHISLWKYYHGKYIYAMKIDDILQTKFKSPQQKAIINIRIHSISGSSLTSL